jgi:carotenoid cleavage dioxygenase-like enzyme
VEANQQRWSAGPSGPPAGDTAGRTGRPFEQGFTNLDSEFLQLELPVEGRIPHWLSGRLFRNGPARFDLRGGGVSHWFDGLAMLHAFSVARGRVSYSNRFLQTHTYRSARARGAVTASAFAADPCKSLFSRLVTVLLPYQMDNANVGIAQIAGRFVAMTETPMAIEFDPSTLGTIGVFPFRDRVRGSLTTAHPLCDGGEWFSYLTRFGLPSRYQIVTLGERRRLVGSLPVAAPAYMHSFAMTERHIVLAEFPFVLDPRGILSTEVPLIGLFRWRPERPTRFLVIDRATGALVRTHEAPACFGFHHVNAYEGPEGLVLDVIVYPDPSVIDYLYLDAIKTAERFPSGELRRYVLPHGGGPVRAEPVSPLGIELPRIDERRRCRRYRYVYGNGVTAGGDFLDQIVRVDTQRATAAAWSEPGCYPGEPVFVPDPASRAEGEGVLLSIVLDSRAGASFLLVLDATTLEERARARMSHHVPFGFHGLWA